MGILHSIIYNAMYFWNEKYGAMHYRKKKRRSNLWGTKNNETRLYYWRPYMYYF